MDSNSKRRNSASFRTLVVFFVVFILLPACSPEAAAPEAPAIASAREEAAGEAGTTSPTQEVNEPAATMEDVVRKLNGVQIDDEGVAELELLIQLCMMGLGFEYVPENNSPVVTLSRRDLSDSEFATEYGFGISTFWSEMGAAESSNQTSALAIEREDVTNASVLDTLSVEGREAWLFALEEAPDSCRVQSLASLTASEVVIPDVEELFADMNERFSLEPTVVTYEREWSDCMRTAGYPASHEGEIISEVGARFEAFLLSIQESASFQVDTDSGNEVLFNQTPELDVAQQSELAEIQAFEIAAATSGLVCRSQSGIGDVERIRSEFEADFLESNAALVSTLLGR